MAGRSEMTILEHLKELRKVLLKTVLGIAVASVTSFILGDRVLNLIVDVSHPDFITNKLLCNLAAAVNSPELCINQTLLAFTNIELAGQFMLHLNLALFGGIVLSLPYTLAVTFRFIKPALTARERVVSWKFTLVAISLLAFGLLFGYFIIAPIGVHFLANYSLTNQIVNQITIQSFTSTVSQTVLAMGIGFELPLIVYYLTKWQVIKPEWLSQNRPIVVVLLLTISAIITPPDVFSMIVVALPLWLLYEVTVMLVRRKIAH